MKTLNKKMLMIQTLSLMTALATVGCGKSTTDGLTEDTSASGAAAGAVGGALSGSSANGTQASMMFKNPSLFAAIKSKLTPIQNAWADTSCPTFKSASGDGCSASGSDMWLSYSDCTFAGAATWSGVQQISISSGSASCGSFPNPTTGTLYRQFVQSSGASTPGSVTLTTNDGAVGTIDDASANLANFDGDSIATDNPDSGYGAAVEFSGGARTQVTVDHHLSVSGVFDHSVTGTLSVSETAGASQRTVTGSLTVYHNLLRVVGTSVFNNVVHSNDCCLPISGTITTTFAAGSNPSTPPTKLGAPMIGKSETLTFSSTCGTATLVSYDGTTTNVALDRCF